MYLPNKICLSIAIAVLVASVNSCNQLPSANQLFKVVDSPELRLSYNSTTTVLPDGKLRANFHAKWVNYMDKNNEWKEIDPNFVKTERGFEMTNAPFEVLAPFYADEAAIFNNNNRYDVFTNQIIYDKPLEQTIQALGTDHIAGKLETGDLGWGKAQYVVYPNAYPQYHADLIYWVHQGATPRLRKFIRFNQKLSANTDFKFKVIYADAVETVNNGKSVTVKSKNADKRGSGWADFYIWDSKDGWAGRKPIRFDFKKPMLASTGPMAINANEYILTKHIEADYFSSAVLPVFTDATATFYPDPHPESTSVDADLFAYHAGGGVSWSSVRNASTCDAGGADNSVTQTAIRSDWFSNNGYVFDRFVTLFNTSSLTAGVTVTSATESVYVISLTNGDNDGTDFISVTTASPASNTTIVSDDFDQTGGTSPVEQISSGSRKDITSVSLNAYLDFAFNSTGIGNINKTGISKFCFREGHDMLDVPIAQNSGQGDYINVYTADQTGTSQDPTLTVVYTLPTTAPTVTSPTATSITGNSATLGANVTSDGGASISAKGICWGMSPAPATNCIPEGTTSTGVFTEAITGLPGGNLIYYRGYATNTVGTGYSSDGTFNTLAINALVDWNNGNVEDITLTANRALTFTNGKSGGVYSLLINQDATGGRAITWPSNVKWIGGSPPTFTATANAVDVVRFIYNGTNYLAVATSLDIK